jgi:hypothetical protein
MDDDALNHYDGRAEMCTYGIGFRSTGSIISLDPLNVKKVRLWLKAHRETGKNEQDGGEWEWEEAVHKIGQDTQDTIPYLVAEGKEHIEYEDSPGVVIDPTLHTWLFDFCALLAQHSRVSEPAPPMEEARVGYTRWKAQYA